MTPLATFVEQPELVGWACLNWIRKESNDRPDPLALLARDTKARLEGMAR